MRILGVGHHLAAIVGLWLILGAHEAGLGGSLLRIAALALSGIRPHAGARVLVEVEADGALGLQGVAFDAVVEDVAHGGIGMREEAVLARAVLAGLRLLELSAVLAVHIEGLVALVELAVEWIEDQAIGTELRLGHSVVADVELVALHLIGELAIGLRALEVGGGHGCRHTQGHSNGT